MIGRQIWIGLIIVVISFTFNYGYAQTVEEEYVRIGLKMPLKSNYEVTLGGQKGFAIGKWENEFKEMFKIGKKEIVVRLDSYYSIENGIYTKSLGHDESEIGPYHIKMGNTYESYNVALEVVEKLRNDGIDAYPAYDNGYQIWIGQFCSKNEAEKELVKLSNSYDNLKIAADNGKKIILQDKKNNVILLFDVSQNIFLQGIPENGQPPLTNVENYRYRDYITFNRVDESLIVINYVSVEHYLYGVVPREMSANWPLEALKAQAVAARNYVIVNKNKHHSQGYDLCDTQDCQVYGGFNWENNKTNKAVDETKSKLIKYNGSPITAFYHSSSGGHTENSENIWSFEIPYIRGVEDEFSLGSPYDSWQLVLTRDEVEEKLKSSGIDIGDIISIKPVSYSKYGRVLELLVEGTKGNYILEKEKPRGIFGYGNLKSTWFDVNSDADVYVMTGNDLEPKKVSLTNATVISGKGIQITSRSKNSRMELFNGYDISTISVIPSLYIFEGKGWGHGLGMSQWGAKRMAELGYSYEQILEHYYTGTKVE